MEDFYKSDKLYPKINGTENSSELNSSQQLRVKRLFEENIFLLEK